MGNNIVKLSDYQFSIPQPIIVFGVPNSGTSLIMNLLHLGGVWIGETKRGNWRNELGFFENEQLAVQAHNSSNMVMSVVEELKRQGYMGGRWAIKQFYKDALRWKEIFDPFWIFTWRNFNCILHSRYRDIKNDGPIDSEKVRKVTSMIENDFKPLRQKIIDDGGKWFDIRPDMIVHGDHELLVALYDELNLIYYPELVNLMVRKDMWRFNDKDYPNEC